ncbi:hypothetical protein [Litoreibacter ascidiaceicola]|nr:hypothetical protein [Litoreibacter ascidiaceicola]
MRQVKASGGQFQSIMRDLKHRICVSLFPMGAGVARIGGLA